MDILNLYPDEEEAAEFAGRTYPWPAEGDTCTVEMCHRQVLPSRTAYRTHWRKFHVANVLLWPCPLGLCNRVETTRAGLKRHLIRSHARMETGAANAVAACTPRVTANRNFRDPGGVSLSPLLHVPIPTTRDQLRNQQAERRRALSCHLATHPIIPHPLENNVCRDEEVYLDILEDGSTSVHIANRLSWLPHHRPQWRLVLVLEPYPTDE
jgi:hypothetical protein